MTFNTGNTKGTDYCIIGNLNTSSNNSHLIGCIGEIIGFYRSLTDTETFVYSSIFDEKVDLAFY